jgi:hypothetical protein
MTCAKGVPRGTENEEASKSKNARCVGLCAAEREACEETIKLAPTLGLRTDGLCCSADARGLRSIAADQLVRVDKAR